MPMPRRIVIPESAQEEFKDLKQYVKRDFGAAIWNAVNAEYKSAIHRIKRFPEAGSPVEELRELGMLNVRSTLVRQTRIVYEFDDEWVIIHMFIATRRDFRTHLMRRLLSRQ